ncbi:MAG: oligosaccharide flippase family protein [Desulfobacterales bacterium]|nr:oligosaccharide flippase family protein [Desulfobacterales bacterium]
MLKSFFRDSAIYTVSALLSRGIAIVLVPLYTRFFQPAEYGALDLLTVFATLANYLVALEISQGVARSFADANSDEGRKACVSTALCFAVVAYGFFLLVALPFYEEIADFLLDSSEWNKAVRAIILAISANGFFFILQDLLRWQLQPLRHAVVSIAYTLVSTAVGVSLVVGLGHGIAGILYGQCAGAVVGSFVAWHAGAARHWRMAFYWEKWREMVAYSAPQVLSSIAVYISLYVDRLLIKEMMALDDVGVYGIGARFGSVVALVMTGLHSSLVPLVFNNYASREMPAHLARIFLYFLVGGISAVLFLCGFSKELVWFFTTPRYYAAWRVIPLIATGVLLANMYIFTLGVYIARRTMLVLIINISAALINIGMNLLLIPRFGLIGAATATMISAMMAFLLYLYFNQRFYPVPFEWKRIVPGVSTCIAFAIILMGLQERGYSIVAGLVSKLILLALGVTIVAFICLGWNEIRGIGKRICKRSI